MGDKGFPGGTHERIRTDEVEGKGAKGREGRGCDFLVFPLPPFLLVDIPLSTASSKSFLSGDY